MNKIQNRLSALRSIMEKQNLDAIYISGTDPHASEYLPERWKTRAFITGFTGSYGMVVVTRDEAGLWTDTRYFLQAEEQLQGTEIKLHKLRIPGAQPPEDWLKKKLVKGNRIGIDPKTLSITGFRNFSGILGEEGIFVVEIPDLFDIIWENRPLILSNPVFELDVKYAGLSRTEKQNKVVEKLTISGADFHIVSMLDELAWLFNLRGSDVEYNPVFTGFGWIGERESILFVDTDKLSEELRRKLENEGVEVKEYNSFYSFLAEKRDKNIFIDPATANYSIYNHIHKQNDLIEGTSLVAHLKARKNDVEIEGFKQAMIFDGVALVEFLYWLRLNIGKTEITEYSIGRKLAEFRSKQENFKGESFAPIVGYKSHGAIVHLTVNSETALPVLADGILLFDSGGQFLNGTTDITRTVALGTISEQQKMDFTLVLKGMIALTLAVFPKGTKGCHLDILARKPLWENGMNYGHGTGHGIGHFLNVHEGPMAIRQEFNENTIEPGMVLSNEPAFYREGNYGIRTENMILCVEKEETLYGRFYGFETLTLCPIDTNLIVKDLCSANEIKWLNDYHKKVNAEIKPHLKKELHSFLDELTAEI